MQTIEKSPSKIIMPSISKTEDIVIPIADNAIPFVKPKGDTGTKVIDRKIIQDVSKEIPIYQNPVYRPPPKPVKTFISEIPGSLFDIDPEMNTNFEEIFHFKKG